VHPAPPTFSITLESPIDHRLPFAVHE
jgi:hypothetical protein